MNTKFVFHVFFPFVASHIMSSYFGFETCVRCKDGKQKVLEMHTLNFNGTFGVVDTIGQCVRCNTYFG